MDQSDKSKWEVDAKKRLKAWTLLEWGVAVGEPYHIVLRIGYAISKREWESYKNTDRSPYQLQTAMSPKAAKELGALLVQYAKKLEAQIPSKYEQN